MTDVVDTLPEPLPREERRRDRSADRKDRVTEDRRRDREPRERRDERDDRPPRRDQHERRSIEERLGPANPMERRDRERENKRRKSPSPPPFNHRDRDRRFSPGLRRTPPYKRSRRDEEHDAGRKGTLEGGEDLGRATGMAGDRRILCILARL